jgi:hypothetical protein
MFCQNFSIKHRQINKKPVRHGKNSTLQNFLPEKQRAPEAYPHAEKIADRWSKIAVPSAA